MIGQKRLTCISSSGFALDVTDANTERFVREALAKVREHLREARYWDAIAEVERALGDAPDNAELQETLTLARELRARAETEQHAQEPVVRARMLLTEARYWDAIAEVEQALGDAPDNAELPETLTVARELRAKQRAQEAVVRARVLLEAAKYDEAIAVLEQVMAAAPGNADLHELLEAAIERARTIAACRRWFVIPVSRMTDEMWAANLYGDVLRDCVLVLEVRAKIDTGELAQRVLTRTIIAAPSEVRVLFERYLPGVSLHHVMQPPAEIPTRVGSLYFLINQSGSAWERIREQGGIRILIRDKWADLEIALYGVISK